MRTAETAFDMLRISKIVARNPVTHFMSLPSGSSKLIGSLCVMREAATVLLQVHGFVWARCAAHVQRKFPRSDPPRRAADLLNEASDSAFAILTVFMSIAF